MKDVRACPVCPSCGDKKFKRLEGKSVVQVRCLSCNKVITI